MNTTYQKASAFLSEIDSDWATLIRTVGDCQLEAKPEREPFEALVRAVAYQQLSTKVGDAILRKFIQHYGQFPHPEQLISSTFDDLRAIGFSGRKIETIQSIAEGAVTGLVPAYSTAINLNDEHLIQQLTSIKGIGRWTVEMMLIFTLQRLDVLPADDFGIVEGYKRLKSLDTPPKRREILQIGEAWRPYRTIASWYLWRVPK